MPKPSYNTLTWQHCNIPSDLNTAGPQLIAVRFCARLKYHTRCAFNTYHEFRLFCLVTQTKLHPFVLWQKICESAGLRKSQTPFLVWLEMA